MTKSSMSSFSQQHQIDPKILAQWTSKKQDRRTVIVFSFLTIFFTIIGLLLVILGSQIQEYSVTYSDTAACNNVQGGCTVTLYVEEKMTSPVYVYYRFDNFFQNHQRYVTSKDDEQLAGKDKPLSELEDCFPILTNRDAGVETAIDGTTPLDPDAPAIPCGLIAHTRFTEKFEIKRGGSVIPVRTTGIAWESDLKDEKYKNIDLTRQWIDMESEQFMNWMRLAGLNDFKKLWAVIDQDLDAGIYEIDISKVSPVPSNYNIADFGTGRRFILTTANSFGGKNILLTVCYLLAAALSWIILAIFLVRMIKNRKKRS